MSTIHGLRLSEFFSLVVKNHREGMLPLSYVCVYQEGHP